MPTPEIPKARMDRLERDVRSKLAQACSSATFIRGTLVTRENVCGKSICKCARGEKHAALYLVASKNGQVRQLYVPRSYESRVRKWLEQYRKTEELLEEISDLYWEKIRKREK